MTHRGRSRPLRTFGRCALILCISSFSLSIATPAFAQDAHLEAGARAFNEGNYEKAVEEFKALLETRPTVSAALYLSNAYLRLGRLTLAKEALLLALKIDPRTLKREAILTLIKNIEKIGCELTVTAEPPGAKASVDGTEPASLPLNVEVTKGEHKVTLTADGYESKELTTTCVEPPIALAAKLVQQGQITVPTEPGTIITVDGNVVDPKFVDAKGKLALTIGRHEVTIKIGNRPLWSTIIEVKADAPIVVEPPPPPAPVPPAPPPPTPVPPPLPRIADGFPSLGLYAGIRGGANLVLRDWDLGNRGYVDQSGVHRILPGSSAMAGVYVGFQVLPRLAVEGEIHWVALPTSVDTSHAIAYGVNVPFNILKGKWTPIVEAGVGVYQGLTGRIGLDSDLRAHVGVGFRGLVTPWLSIRADVRDTYSDGLDTLGANNLELLVGAEIFVFRPKR